MKLARCSYYTAVEWGAFTIFAVMTVVLLTQLVRPHLARQKVNKAVSLVAGELRFARHYAVKHKKFTAVLIPTAQDDNFGGVTNPRYKASALRICTLGEAPTPDATRKNFQGRFDSYVSDRGSWRFLPRSVFVGYTDTFGEHGKSGVGNRCNVVNGVPFPEAASTHSINNVRALIFSPNGAAVGSAQGANPGTRDTYISMLSAVIRNERQLWPLNERNTVTIIVNRLSGKLKFN